MLGHCPINCSRLPVGNVDLNLPNPSFGRNWAGLPGTCVFIQLGNFSPSREPDTPSALGVGPLGANSTRVGGLVARGSWLAGARQFPPKALFISKHKITVNVLDLYWL